MINLHVRMTMSQTSVLERTEEGWSAAFFRVNVASAAKWTQTLKAGATLLAFNSPCFYFFAVASSQGALQKPETPNLQQWQEKRPF